MIIILESVKISYYEISQKRLDIMESTFDTILNTAMLLFGEKGYHATTTREIAKNSGVSETTIFNQFTSKSELYNRVTGQLVDVLAEDIKGLDIVLSYDNLDEDLPLLAMTYFKVYISNVFLLRILIDRIDNTPDLSDHYSCLFPQLEQHFRQYLCKAINNGRKNKNINEISEHASLFISHIARIALETTAHDNVFYWSTDLMSANKDRLTHFAHFFAHKLLTPLISKNK